MCDARKDNVIFDSVNLDDVLVQSDRSHKTRGSFYLYYHNQQSSVKFTQYHTCRWITYLGVQA